MTYETRLSSSNLSTADSVPADVRLVKVNDSYIRVVGDHSVVADIAEAFTFTSPGAKFDPRVRNGFWDGKIRLLSKATNLIYAGLLNQVFAAARERNYTVENLVPVVESPLIDWHAFCQEIGLTKNPRDYQLDAITHCWNKRRVAVQSPTGSGKSLLCYLLARAVVQHYGSILIIVPTVNLANQLASDFAEYGYRDEISKIYSGSKPEKLTDITVSTWQSLQKADSKWLNQFFAIVVDEVHTATAKVLKSLMELATNVPIRYGLSGTIQQAKTDRLVIEGLFGPVYTVATTRELIDQGHLADVKINVIELKYSNEDIKDVRAVVANKTDAREKYFAEYQWIIDNDRRNEWIAKLATHLRGNTIVLFKRLEHGETLRQLISQFNSNSARPINYITGEVAGDIREEVRQLVINCSDSITVASSKTFAVGVNIPNLNNIIFAAPTKAQIQIIQSIGRGVRLSDNKTSCTLYDIGDNLRTPKGKPNYSLQHLLSRIEIYDQEQFDYNITQYTLTK